MCEEFDSISEGGTFCGEGKAHGLAEKRPEQTLRDVFDEREKS